MRLHRPSYHQSACILRSFSREISTHSKTDSHSPEADPPWWTHLTQPCSFRRHALKCMGGFFLNVLDFNADAFISLLYRRTSHRRRAAGSRIIPVCLLRIRRSLHDRNTDKVSSLTLQRTISFPEDTKPAPDSPSHSRMSKSGTGRRRRSSSIIYQEPQESLEQISDQAALPNLNSQWVNSKGTCSSSSLQLFS